MNLHEVIEFVLKEENKGMTPIELTEYINKHKLYSRNDGKPVPVNQVIERLQEYSDLFEQREDGFYSNKVYLSQDLINIAFNMHSQLRNVFAHNFIPSNEQISSIVPFIFFYKRVLSKSHFKENNSSSADNYGFNLKGLINWIHQLNTEDDLFYEKLNDVFASLKGFTNSPISESFEREMLKLDVYDFKSISDLEFGELFSEIINKTIVTEKMYFQYYTPNKLSNLIGEIFTKKDLDGKVLYNPGSGISSISTYLNRNISSNFKLYGEEVSPNIYVLSLMNLICNGIRIESFKNQSILEQDRKSFADIVISDPPFGARVPLDRFEERYPIKTKDMVLVFVQRAIEALKQGGTAAIFVPEGFLFSIRRDFSNLRKYLIDNKLVESIISLPAGILNPVSGTKISLLVLSKKDNDNVLLIDASTNDFFKKDGVNVILDNSKISRIYHNQNVETLVAEPESFYGIKKFDRIQTERIIEYNYDLNIKRYLIKENNDPDLVQLSEILESHVNGRSVKTDEFPIVNISNLNTDFKEIYLNIEELQKNERKQRGVLINKPTLLIGSIYPNLKPTYYNSIDTPVIVSPNVYVFSIKEDKAKDINIEYLLFELSSQKVLEQFEALATGSTSLRRVLRRDLLQLKVRVPIKSEQDKIVTKQKEALYAAKLTEADRFAEKMGLTRVQEKELLGFIKHEVGNITPGISTDVENVQSYLKGKIDFNDKISGRKNSANISDVFERIQSNINDVNNLMDNIESIIRIGDEKLSRKNVKFRKYINSEIQKQANLIKDNNINVHIGIDEEYLLKSDKNIFIDTNQFSYVVRNFVINSVKHAFTELITEKTIIINLNQDEGFYYVSLINNGIPFPEGFTIKDFLSFGGRVDNQKGSGLGGYLINKVVQNHNGSIDLLESGTALFIDDPNTESGFHSNKFIKVGAHFFIQIPKEQ